MNQYDVDDYVLPRRRSPWVLVGDFLPFHVKQVAL